MTTWNVATHPLIIGTGNLLTLRESTRNNGRFCISCSFVTTFLTLNFSSNSNSDVIDGETVSFVLDETTGERVQLTNESIRYEGRF